MVVDIFNNNNKYGIIYTDPPWQQTRGGIEIADQTKGRV